jgi:hypothetical protein
LQDNQKILEIHCGFVHGIAFKIGLGVWKNTHVPGKTNSENPG